MDGCTDKTKVRKKQTNILEGRGSVFIRLINVKRPAIVGILNCEHGKLHARLSYGVFIMLILDFVRLI